MRLTLRTLLAYLDGVLDAEDAGDLQKKIENSPLAQDLVQRIEATLQHPPHDPVSPLASGEADANLVAEYLDSTLRPELEPEFERHCLEADDRLEEIAACHRILSMVVRERTAVPQSVRHRIHRLREQLGWGGTELPEGPQTLESRPGAWLNPPGAIPGDSGAPPWGGAPAGAPTPMPQPATGSRPIHHVPPSASDSSGPGSLGYGSRGSGIESEAGSTDPRWRKTERWRDEEEPAALEPATNARHASGSLPDADYEQPVAGATLPVLPDVFTEQAPARSSWPVLVVGLVALALGLWAVRPHWLSPFGVPALVPVATSQTGPSGPDRSRAEANRPAPATVDAPAAGANTAPRATDELPSRPELGPEMGIAQQTPTDPAASPARAASAAPADGTGHTPPDEASVPPLVANEALVADQATSDDSQTPLFPPTPDTIRPVGDEEGVSTIRQPSRMRPADPIESEVQPDPGREAGVPGLSRPDDPALATQGEPGGELAATTPPSQASDLLGNQTNLPAAFPGDELVLEEPAAINPTAGDPATVDDPAAGANLPATAGHATRADRAAPNDLASNMPLPNVAPPELPVDETPGPSLPPTTTAAPQFPLALRLSSERDVVIRGESSGPAWIRADAQSDLPMDHVLVVLPTYRSSVLTNRGLRVTFVGPAEWSFTETREGGLDLACRYGKTLVELLPGQSAGTFTWQANGRAGTIKLEGEGSAIALHAWQWLPPGADPASSDGVSPARRVTQLRVLRGAAVWLASDQEEVVRPEITWNLVDDGSGFGTPATEPWAWVEGTDILPIDQRASRELEPFLPAGGAILPVLQERATKDRHVEQQSLAVRCLIALGEYAAPWESLNRPAQRSYWTHTVSALQGALARNPAEAARIQGAIEASRGGAGRFLYRMLRGYSPDDLLRGGAEELVSALRDDALDIRVLAAENLGLITGVRNYQPAGSVKSRATALNRWQRDLVRGEIRYTRNISPVPQGPEQALQSARPDGPADEPTER